MTEEESKKAPQTEQPVEPAGDGSATSSRAEVPAEPVARKKPRKRNAAATRMADRDRLRQDKARIQASLKRRVWGMTLLLNLSCAVIIGCIYYLGKTNDPWIVSLVSVILAVDLLFIGFLTLKVYRHYRLGREAMDRQRSRMDVIRTKRLLKQYASSLSHETRATLLRTPDGADGAASSEMFLQLKSSELSNALQFLCMSARVGELVLTCASGDGGSVFLDRSTVVHAAFEGKTGVEAMARLLRAGDVSAHFFAGRRSAVQSLDQAISQLLLEAAVMGDEMGPVEPNEA